VEWENGSKVHKGFKEGLDEVWEMLHTYLEDLRQKNKKIWITGHSLGAALANLAGDRYKDNLQGLYTFGSPRVGNNDFKANFSVNAYRFINNNDIVTKVPPKDLLGFQHVGELKYIDSNGKVQDNISILKQLEDGIIGEFKNVLDSFGWLGSGFTGFIPFSLRDHIPTLYATHIWNNIPGVG
jgi:triacylglycerol lipase